MDFEIQKQTAGKDGAAAVDEFLDVAAAEFYLPLDFLDDDEDDLFSEETKSAAVRSESDEESCFEERSALREAKVLGSSPQSTLSVMGQESPEGSSSVSSPPSSPLEQSKEDPWDLLYEAAGQVARMSLNGKSQASRGTQVFIPQAQPRPVPRKASPPIPAPTNSNPAYPYYFASTAFAHRQIQTAHFHMLKQQQLMKQQREQQQLSAAAWGTYAQQHTRSAVTGGAYPATALGLAPSAWPPLQQQEHQTPPPPPAQVKPNTGSVVPGLGMHAVYLSAPGAKRECAGTGVFLPRQAGVPSEPKKKPAVCTPVLLPARVVQALNLNLEDLGAQPRSPGGFLLDHDALINRSNAMLANQKQKPASYFRAQQTPAPQTLVAAELNLPQEWTY